MKKILYVGQIAIEGSASCTHVRNRARFFNNIGYSVHEVLDKLMQIVNMDSSKILQMKLNALNTAKQVFSEGQYYNVAKCFLEGEGFDSQNKEEAKL